MVGHNFSEEEIMRMLIGDELGSFAGQGFEGSNDEHKIFMEVIYGVSDAKTYTTTSSNKSEADRNQAEDPFVEDLEQLEMNKTYHEINDSAVVHADANNQNVEPTGLTSQEQATTELLSRGLPNPGDCLTNNVPMEILTYGSVFSSFCYGSNNIVESLGQVNVHIGDIAFDTKCRHQHADGDGDGDVVMDSRSANKSSDHFEAHVSAAVNLTEAIGFQMKKKRNCSIRQLPSRLECHAHRLLMDSGWVIEPRKRHDRVKLAFYFKPPENGPMFTSLVKAWKSCGVQLSGKASASDQSDVGREWRDYNKFLADFNEIITCLDKEIESPEKSLTLLHRWQLLDPFLAVVWIDKRMGALRVGKALKAVNSTTFFLNDEADRNVKDTSKSVSDGPKNGECMKSCAPKKKAKKSSVKSASILKEIDGISNGSSPCASATSGLELFLCEDTKRANNGSDIGLISSPTDSSSLISDLLDHQEEDNHWTGSIIVSAGLKPEHAAFRRLVNGSFKKARKKSKKISEIEANELKCKDVEADSPCGDCSEDFNLSVGANLLISSSVSACIEQLDPLSRSSEAGSVATTQKKPVKRETKVGRRSSKQKKANPIVPIDDELGSINADNHEIKKIPKENGRKRLRCRIDDDDLLITAIIRRKDFSSSIKHSSPKTGTSQAKALRKLKGQKGKCKLLLRTPGKGGNLATNGKRFCLTARTVLCWLIEMGALSPKDDIEYRNLKNDEVVKEGWITHDGILCKCCNKIFSVSEFKAHAGAKLNRPSRNLFVHHKESYTNRQLLAWSAEYRARKGGMKITEVEDMDQNDDTCGLCGDGGELICCDNCPSTYHQGCLPSQEFPEGNWYCSNCICRICGDVANSMDSSSSHGTLECSQCQNKYHDNCIVEKTAYKGEVGSNMWFCCGACQEVFLGLSSRLGVANFIDDGVSWSIMRCIDYDQKLIANRIISAPKIALMAECNTKLAIALTLMEECFLPMVDPRTGIDMIPQVLYNWGSKFARLNYKGFYTAVLEKNDEIISVASIRVHGVRLAEMPLIATSNEHRRQGMCKRLINAIEEMLRSFKVEMLVLSAIPSLVETWTSGFGFEPVGDDERKQLSNVNLMLFPGTTMLKKYLCEAKVEPGASHDAGASHDGCSKNVRSVGMAMELDSNTIESSRHCVDSVEGVRIGQEEEKFQVMSINPRVDDVVCTKIDIMVSSSECATLVSESTDHREANGTMDDEGKYNQAPADFGTVGSSILNKSAEDSISEDLHTAVGVNQVPKNRSKSDDFQYNLCGKSEGNSSTCLLENKTTKERAADSDLNESELRRAEGSH